jgi:hypothetical protein
MPSAGSRAHVLVPLCVCVTALLAYISAGAALVRDPAWSAGHAFYFCFVSLLTVSCLIWQI